MSSWRLRETAMCLRPHSSDVDQNTVGSQLAGSEVRFLLLLLLLGLLLLAVSSRDNSLGALHPRLRPAPEEPCYWLLCLHFACRHAQMGASPPPGTRKLQLTAAKSPHPLPPELYRVACVWQLSHTCQWGWLRRDSQRGSEARPHAFKSQRGNRGLSFSICKMGHHKNANIMGPFCRWNEVIPAQSFGFPRGKSNGSKRKGTQSITFNGMFFLDHPSYEGGIQKPFQDPPTQR